MAFPSGLSSFGNDSTSTRSSDLPLPGVLFVALVTQAVVDSSGRRRRPSHLLSVLAEPDLERRSISRGVDPVVVSEDAQSLALTDDPAASAVHGIPVLAW